jgi:hypothetical protein
MLFDGAKRITVMVTVKAYPQLSAKYNETVCVAGVRLDTPAPQHVRLFPVPFRDMQSAMQFQKYDVLKVDAVPHNKDRRPESMRPDMQTLEIVGKIPADGDWMTRAQYVRPLVVPSLCGIQRSQLVNLTSLGVFRPKVVERFWLEPAEERPAALEMLAAQGVLWDQERSQLEKPPFRFMYQFRCEDDACRGHRMGIIDWEVGASFFAWRARYGAEEVAARMHQKWFDEVASAKRDLHFFVGNMEQYPKTFMLLGVFWPPRGVMDQDTLF